MVTSRGRFNNAFNVGFKTVPMDDTGHRAYFRTHDIVWVEELPVRDPFFNMLRRSLSAFMSVASADFPCYPFATNRVDYDNLLGVYLDAVFFQRLKSRF